MCKFPGTPIPDALRKLRYPVIHDILHARMRLLAIRLDANDLCISCNAQDTLQHRITWCREGVAQWTWTRQLPASMLQTDPLPVPEDWLYRPQFRLWPPQRHRATLWVQAHLLAFRTQRNRALTPHNYHDFLKRSRRKLYQRLNRMSLVGDYLSVLDTQM
jgi:hypothetical protein